MNLTEVRNIIRDAVANRRTLSFMYDDLPRLVEPHACGITSKGKYVLRGFQPAGGTSREHGWKLFTAAKIESLAPTDIIFDGPRPGYKMGDKQIASIEEQLDA